MLGGQRLLVHHDHQSHHFSRGTLSNIFSNQLVATASREGSGQGAKPHSWSDGSWFPQILGIVGIPALVIPTTQSPTGPMS